MEKDLDERARLQQIIAEMGGCRELMGVIREQIMAMSSAITEFTATISSIKALKGVKAGTEILVPIGSDSFVPAKLTFAGKVEMGVGAEVFAERTSDDAVVALEARVAELGKAIDQARAELEKLDERVGALRPEAEELVQKMKKDQPEPGTHSDV
jgi:prefoldin alpha subunit